MLNPEHLVDDQADKLCQAARFRARDIHTGQVDEDFQQDILLQIITDHHNQPVDRAGELRLTSVEQAARHVWCERMKAADRYVETIACDIDQAADIRRHTQYRTPLKSADQITQSAAERIRERRNKRRSLKAGQPLISVVPGLLTPDGIEVPWYCHHPNIAIAIELFDSIVEAFRR